MPLGIDPTVDWPFKRIFGDPAHPEVTIHYLHAVLGQIGIREVKILNPLLDPKTAAGKLSVVDILARDDQGRQFNIEMQTSLPAGLPQRLLFYSSRMYANQLGRGKNYTNLRPVISICVLGKVLFTHHSQLHSEFLLRDRAGHVFHRDLQIHTIELPKLVTDVHNIGTASDIDRWSFFLRHAAEFDGVELRTLFPESEVQQAIGVLEMIAKSPTERMLYDARLKVERDEAARIEFGRMEGRMEGEQIGQIRLMEKL